jgi:uncharacterized membrane protein YbhN (UPF0104 family)
MGAVTESVAVDPELPRGNDGLDDRFEQMAVGEERRLRRTLIYLALLGIVVATLVFAVPGLQEVGERIRTVSPAWVALAVLLEIASCAAYVLAFRKIFYRAPRRLAIRVALTELGFGAVVPAGGAGGIAVGAWVVKAKGGSLQRFMRLSAVLFLLTSAINAGTLALVGLLVGVGFLPSAHPLTLGVLPGLVGALGIAAFLSIPAVAAHWVPRERAGRAARWLRGTASVVRDTRAELRRPGWSLVGSIGYLWFDIAVLWVCFRAFGAPPTVGILTLAYIIGYVGNLIQIPGGVGVLDGGLTAALVLYGVGATHAAAAVLVYHGIVLWIPTLLGTVAFARLHHTLDEPLRLKPEREPSG